jgi:translation elongation factor EF-1alpha
MAIFRPAQYNLTFDTSIDKFEPPTRLLDKPFRLSVSDFFKGGVGGMGGITVAGKIETGTIQIGDDVLAIPGGENGVVKGIIYSIIINIILCFNIR